MVVGLTRPPLTSLLEYGASTNPSLSLFRPISHDLTSAAGLISKLKQVAWSFARVAKF